jgi:hypothetical protein
MAQFQSRPWDAVGQMKLQVSLRLLRFAAEAWAKPDLEAPSIDSMVAVLLRVFAMPWSNWYWPRELREMNRSLDEWLADVEHPLIECMRLAANPAAERQCDARATWGKMWVRPARVKTALEQLHATLTGAARDWSDGNPERPRTERVLHDLVMMLFRHGLVKRPPPSRVD